MISQIEDGFNITIPDAILEKLNLKTGDQLDAVIEDGKIILKPLLKKVENFLDKDGYVDENAFKTIVIYPVVISPKENDGYHLVTIPDFMEFTTAMTAGRSIAEAMFMARDYIMIVCEHLQEQGTPLPAPSPMDTIEHKPGDIVTLIDADIGLKELIPGLLAMADKDRSGTGTTGKKKIFKAKPDKEEYFAQIDRGIADIENI